MYNRTMAGFVCLGIGLVALSACSDRPIYLPAPAASGLEGVIACAPSIGADGTVYIGSFDFKLYAIGP